MQPAIVGLAIGLAGSFVAGRAIEAMLYGVGPNDVPTFAAVLALVATCALTACLIPAQKAAAIDPAVTLRSE